MKPLQASTRPLPEAGSRVWSYCQGNLFPKIQEVMLDAWSAYSKPVPSSCSELLTLFLQCCCIAVLTGGLLYNWMFSSLEYPFHLSSAIAVSFSLLLLLILFLVHPVRCMFTIIIPTLGTKQGRRLLLSTCFMTVAVNTIPNIMDNIKTILQVIKCICKNYSESLLTSTILLGKASMQFGHQVKEVTDKMADNFLMPRNGHFQYAVDHSHSWVREQMLIASQKIKDDISAVELLVKQALLVANRVAAGFFLFYLLFESAWYLKSYLTNLRFDNIYITKKLKVWAVDKKAAHLLTSSPKKLITSTGLKLSREEMMLCLVRMMLPSLVLMVTVVIIATDYIAFYLADTAMNEVAQFPTVPITLNIKYDVKINALPFIGKIFNGVISGEQSIVNSERTYQQNLTFISADCTMKRPSPPNNFVVLAVGMLYCIIYAMILLETYVQRLRRKISASFFERQEDQRVQYLYRVLLRKHNKKEQQPLQKLRGICKYPAC
ncbi:osteoclast stimulatory transmembrane protein [Chelonoidis abingdonii]|uniref:osteoclast stimulatory transmembrane protein n=1 Tax=Chelonoidis abingdonii TaxID=106734 RepID=UPI0013F25DDD|nr:osteoclast stimulatory transmembrane protein [Chelonoidis abingdonii]